MTGYQVSTLIAFLAVLIAIVVLTLFDQNVPAAIVGVLGSLLTSFLPSLLPKVSVAAASASMRAPSMPDHSPTPIPRAPSMPNIPPEK
jgi:hypothetical protein